MLFKAAITIVSGAKPFLVQVAIPDGASKFIIHEYRFSKSTDAILLQMDYFNEYIKNPDTILAYHKSKISELEANLELPFQK